MDLNNLPAYRYTFGIGKTVGGAWKNALNSSARFSGFIGRGSPVGESTYSVVDSLDSAHEQLHSRMASRLLTTLKTGRSVQSASLSPDPRYNAPVMDNSGMTSIGQHTAPIYGKGDFTRPNPATITFNPWERDRGSLTYMTQPGVGIHSAVPANDRPE